MFISGERTEGSCSETFARKNGKVGVPWFTIMATCESIEYIVLADNTSDLETALKDNLRPIVEQLRKEGLLKDAVYERVKDTQVNLTSLERAGMIVTSVKEYVQIEPSNYYKFISILKREERHYRDVIKILEKSYREHQRGKEKDEPDLPTSIPVSGIHNTGPKSPNLMHLVLCHKKIITDLNVTLY